MWRRGGGFSACVRRRRAVRLPRLGDFPKSGNPNRDPPCTGESISAFRKAPEPARLRGRVGCEFGLRRRVARRRRVAGGGEGRVGGRVGRRRRVGRVAFDATSGRAVFRKAEIQTAIPPAPGKVFPLFGRRPSQARLRGDLGLCGVVGRRPSRARLRGDLGCAAGSQGARARRGGAATLGRAAWSRGSDSAAHPSRSTGRPTTAPRTRPRRAGAASCGSRSPLDAASRLRRCVPSSARSRAQRAQTASQRAFTAAAIATKRGSARNDSSRGQRSSQSLS